MKIHNEDIVIIKYSGEHKNDIGINTVSEYSSDYSKEKVYMPFIVKLFLFGIVFSGVSVALMVLFRI